MNRIRAAILGCGLLFGALLIIELIQGQILLQAVIGIIALGIICFLPFAKEEKIFHDGEMLFVWGCILLFGLYAGLKAGGIV